MAEEVKKILNNFIKIVKKPTYTKETYDGNLATLFKTYTLEISEIKILLNYITNLQKEKQSLKNNYNDNEQAIHKIMKENEELKDTIKKDNHILGCNFSKKDKYKEERDIYKQRNEKAIEYIKENLFEENNDCGCEWQQFPNYEDAKTRLLNTLQGGDEN